jgi:hypothetical protein
VYIGLSKVSKLTGHPGRYVKIEYVNSAASRFDVPKPDFGDVILLLRGSSRPTPPKPPEYILPGPAVRKMFAPSCVSFPHEYAGPAVSFDKSVFGPRVPLTL